MNSISFVSNHRSTLAARLFARSIALSQSLLSYRLITTCATDLEMTVFRGWITRERPVDLVLPPDWHGKPVPRQQAIIDQVYRSGGRLIETVPSEDEIDERLIKTIRMSKVCVVMELEEDHWLCDWSSQLFSLMRTLTFQWAITSPTNAGSKNLTDTGRASPLYPAQWQTHFAQFLDGDFRSGRDQPRQLKLL